MVRVVVWFLLSAVGLAAEESAIEFPPHFPPPQESEVLAKEESIALGKKLFHDNALSVTNTVSCAFCHLPHEAFSDPSLQPWGVRPGQSTRRHSMPLFNLAWKEGPFRWDGEEATLKGQILRPITDPIELGEDWATLPGKLAGTSDYSVRFQDAFGDSAITPDRVATAIEHYLFSLISANSKFDQAEEEKVALTAEEKRGRELFFNPANNSVELKGAGCAQCHPAPLFTDHQFHNNGLVPRRSDFGRAEVTQKMRDRGKFATPSLRNIEVTAPYMHDARFATLEEVVAHYSSGLHESESLSPDLKNLNLSQEEQAALVAFLRTLTDPIYIEREPVEKVPVKVLDPFAY